MKKSSKPAEKDTMRPEYDFSKGVRGKYTSRYREGVNLVHLDPDVAKLFPDSEAVNQALRVIAAAAARTGKVAARKRTAA